MGQEILLSMSMDNVVKATFSLLKNIPSLCPVFSNISKEMGGLIMLANLTGGGGVSVGSSLRLKSYGRRKLCLIMVSVHTGFS